MDKLYVSGEGLERLKADLAECNERRMKVAKVIEQADEGAVGKGSGWHWLWNEVR